MDKNNFIIDDKKTLLSFNNNNKFINTVRIPEGVKRIGKECFTSDYRIETIYIPASVEYIDDYAFGRTKNVILHKDAKIKRIGIKNWVNGCKDNFELLTTLQKDGGCKFEIEDEYYEAPQTLKISYGTFLVKNRKNGEYVPILFSKNTTKLKYDILASKEYSYGFTSVIYTKNNIEDLELYDCLDFEKIIDKSNCEDGLLQNVEKFESDNNYLYAIYKDNDGLAIALLKLLSINSNGNYKNTYLPNEINGIKVKKSFISFSFDNIVLSENIEFFSVSSGEFTMLSRKSSEDFNNINCTRNYTLNYVTDVVGDIKIYNDYLQYVVSNDSIVILNIFGKKPIVIPDTIEDLPVKRVLKNAFSTYNGNKKVLKLGKYIEDLGELDSEKIYIESSKILDIEEINKYVGNRTKYQTYLDIFQEEFDKFSLHEISEKCIMRGKNIKLCSYENYEYLRYEKDGEKYCEITKVYNMNLFKGIVPNEINGCIVEKIGANAFEGIRGIKKLIIPEGVTFIGYKAFYDSTIVEVELPKSIKIIQENAFSKSKLDEVIIPHPDVIFKRSCFAEIDEWLGRYKRNVNIKINFDGAIYVDKDNIIYSSLNNSFINKENLLIRGISGIGKTSIVKSWGEYNENKCNVIYIDGNSLNTSINEEKITFKDIEVFGQLFDKGWIGEFKKDKKVIVIDNYHSIPDKLKSHIDLLLKGYVVDYNEDNKLLKLTKLKFVCLIETISTINYGSNYILKDNKLKVIDFFADKNLCYRYLDYRLQKQIKCSSMLKNMKDLLRYSRKLFILDKWIKDDRLNFDTIDEINESIEKGNGKTFVNSTFTMLINEFDGTIDDFLSKWNQYCNSLKFSIVNEIFSSYEDPEILYN